MNLDYELGTMATKKQVESRDKIIELFENRPMPDKHLMSNLGLYMRSSALAKVLFMNELYEHILNIPGVIVEFGTWWGQNLVLAENLRAIYEPFNNTRQIIGFDTFSGYEGFSDVDIFADIDAGIVKEGGYTTSEKYKNYLDTLLSSHEGNNVLGYVRKYKLVEGNVVDTVPDFFSAYPETVVALAYFDLALYEPTKVCLEAIRPHLVPGSLIMLDQFNSPGAPGETLAFWEAFGNKGYTIKKSKYLADRTLVFIK